MHTVLAQIEVWFSILHDEMKGKKDGKDPQFTDCPNMTSCTSMVNMQDAIKQYNPLYPENKTTSVPVQL